MPYTFSERFELAGRWFDVFLDGDDLFFVEMDRASRERTEPADPSWLRVGSLHLNSITVQEGPVSPWLERTRRWAELDLAISYWMLDRPQFRAVEDRSSESQYDKAAALRPSHVLQAMVDEGWLDGDPELAGIIPPRDQWGNSERSRRRGTRIVRAPIEQRALPLGIVKNIAFPPLLCLLIANIGVLLWRVGKDIAAPRGPTDA